MASPGLNNIKSLISDLKGKIAPVAKSVVGLDIGSFSIKVVELKKVDSGWELVKFVVAPMELDISREKLSALIKQTFAAANIGAAQKGAGGIVNTSVSGQAVMVRYIQLPQMNKQDLHSAIKFEAGKYIPFKIDEVVLDCQILKEDIGDHQMRVLLVSAKKEFIEAHIKLLADAGLEIGIIDVDSLALINAHQINFSAAPEGATCALLNIGAGQTNINIIKDGDSCFSRDVISGGNDITRMIAGKMKIDFGRAEQLKCQPAEKKEELFNFVLPFLDNLTPEVRLSFDYYESRFARGVDKLYLSGGACNLAGLDKYLADALGVSVEIWDPLSALKINPGIDRDKLFPIKSQLPIAIGLAIRK